MTKEAIILAGGLGMRIRSVIGDLPKPMARVCGRPFMEYLLDHLAYSGITRTILSTGYKHETIKAHFGERYKSLDISYSVEVEPLGTGGALKLSLNQIKGEQCFVLNGDSYFDIELQRLENFHTMYDPDSSIALFYRRDESRYGSVQLGQDSRITAFAEKKSGEGGLVNAGVYLVKKNLFEKTDTPERFSFERDFLSKHLHEINVRGFIFSGYFVDIGIPEDLKLANITFLNKVMRKQ